jgi:hypothetical protein
MKMENELDRFSESLMRFSGSLVAQYDTIFEHRGNVGDSREKAINEYLRKVMPSRFGFSKGEMFDSAGRNSGEVDLIMYDPVFSPTFSDGSGKILAPFESCFGAIECKSTLTTTELSDCLRKIQKYRAMKRQTVISNAAQLSPYTSIVAGQAMTIGNSYNVPLLGVFAFENKIALDSLLEILKGDVAIDFIVVPGKFIYLGRMSSGPPVYGSDHIIAETQNSVAVWIMYLQTMLNEIRLVGVDTNALLRRLTAGLPLRRRLLGAGPT